MNVREAIAARRSVRKFRKDPVPDEALARVLEAARLAPSGKNLQPWKFIVVRDPETRKKLAAASAGQAFVASAPVVIVVCGFPSDAYPRLGRFMNSWPVDAAIAMEHIVLQAVEEGLGTCWIGAFEEAEVKAVLGVPGEARVLALTPLGRPDESPAPRGRKPLATIVSYEKF